MNTIIIPKGGTYKITLPDGSDVWLNSESSLSYPVAFIGGERKVELSGEAYFEITRDERKPFRVHSNNQIVEVLGTHFNINTYEESGFIETTLVEGSVRVTQNYSNGKPYKTRLLKPGQQSLTNLFKPEIKIENVDIEKEIAWKNGFFKFKNTNIQNIMREIERWYDVKVQYEGKIPSEEFTGIISRDVEITKMLKILEQGGGVQFSVSGKRILVKSD
jgi:ferric-dicitrate binding protein FerR (iron transport regulator)